jgi:hypothetical protein
MLRDSSKNARNTSYSGKPGRPGIFDERVLLKVYLEKSERDAFTLWVEKHGFSGMSAVAREMIKNLLKKEKDSEGIDE